MRGAILDAASLGDDIDLSPIAAKLSHCQQYSTTSAEQTAERLRDCEVIITNKVVISAELMAQNPQLKLICVAATGTNNIDTVAAKEQGICVKNAVGYGTNSVAQHTLQLILSLTGRSRDYQAGLNNWPQSPFFCQLSPPFSELSGKTLGVIGGGNTGSAVANIARAFGMHVLISQRPGSMQCPQDRTPLEQLLKQSDIITLHCPLADNTRNLIGKDELQQLKGSALLINCARGGIVDEEALLFALQEKTIAGAALDVLAQEPPATNHPLINYQRHHHNLILTPHIAWASLEARQRLVKIVADNIAKSQKQ